MTDRQAKMNVDLHPGDRLSIGGNVSVQLVHKSGRAARIMVFADREAPIVKTPCGGQGAVVQRQESAQKV